MCLSPCLTQGERGLGYLSTRSHQSLVEDPAPRVEHPGLLIPDTSCPRAVTKESLQKEKCRYGGAGGSQGGGN